MEFFKKTSHSDVGGISDLVLNDYVRGFEDALDLITHRIQKKNLPVEIKDELQEIIERVRESKITKIERELGL